MVPGVITTNLTEPELVVSGCLVGVYVAGELGTVIVDELGYQLTVWERHPVGMASRGETNVLKKEENFALILK